jgi:hypothetical protein
MVTIVCLGLHRQDLGAERMFTTHPRVTGGPRLEENVRPSRPPVTAGQGAQYGSGFMSTGGPNAGGAG